MPSSRTRNPAPTPPEKLSAADLERHHEMVEHVREAQQLQAAAAELIAAANVWGRDLGKRYDLGPDGRVLEDGTIERPAGA
jgi:hypothetical protein